MTIDMSTLVADLSAESVDLDTMLAPLDEAQWRLATPAAGWSIADQVSHLAYFDETALAAAINPDRFRRDAAELTADDADFPDRIAARFRAMPGRELLAWLRGTRATFLDTFATLEPSQRLPWYGPDMSAASSVTRA